MGGEMTADCVWKIGAAGSVVIAAIGLGTAWRSELLTDSSTATTKPYSFARVQLWWWTMLVTVGYVLACGWRGVALNLTQGTVLLLGISATTTAGGRLIDSADAGDAAVARHQDTASQGFLTDILSDGQGVSIHRFQALLFNLIFGGIFAVHLWRHLAEGEPFIDFKPEQLSLMGISSATYLGVKLGENKAAPAPVVKPG